MRKFISCRVGGVVLTVVVLVAASCSSKVDPQGNSEMSKGQVPSEVCGVPLNSEALSLFAEGEEEIQEVYVRDRPLVDCEARVSEGYLFRFAVSEQTLEGQLVDVEGRLAVDFRHPVAEDVSGAQALVEDLSSVLYVDCPDYGNEEGLSVLFAYGWNEVRGIPDADEQFLLLLEDVVDYVRDEYRCEAV